MVLCVFYQWSINGCYVLISGITVLLMVGVCSINCIRGLFIHAPAAHPPRRPTQTSGVAQSKFSATASQNQIATNSSSRWSGRRPNSSSRWSGLLGCLVLVAIRCVFLALRCVASPSLSRWSGRADQILLGCLVLLALRCVLLAHRCMASRGVPCPDLAPLQVRADLQECDEGGWLLFGIVFVPLRSTIVFCFPPTTSCHSTGPMLVPRAWSRTPSVCPNRSGPLLPGRRSCPFVRVCSILVGLDTTNLRATARHRKIHLLESIQDRGGCLLR